MTSPKLHSGHISALTPSKLLSRFHGNSPVLSYPTKSNSGSIDPILASDVSGINGPFIWHSTC